MSGTRNREGTMDRERQGGGSSPVERGAAREAGGDGAAVVPGPPEDEARKVEVVERPKSTRGLLGEMLPEVALLIGAIYLFYLAGRFGGQADPGQLGPGFWPRMAATGLAIALVVRIVQTVRARNRPIIRLRSALAEEEEVVDVDWRRVGIAIALVVGYVLGSMFIGYLFATAAFLTAFIWIGGQRRWFVPLIASAGALISAYVFIGVVYV